MKKKNDGVKSWKQRLKRLMKNKIFLFSIIGLFLVGLGVGAWALIINQDTTLYVINHHAEGIRVTIPLQPSYVLNATSNAVEFEETFTIENLDGDLNMKVSDFEVVRTNLNSSCPNYETDCEVYLERDGITPTNLTLNDEFVLNSSFTDFILHSNCVRFSCEQDIDVSIEFIPVEQT